MMEIDELLFARNLKRLMKKRKMSNRVLSAYTKICTSTIECYRLGKSFPTSPKIQLIAKALGVEVSELFKEESTKTLADERTRAIEDCKEVVRRVWIEGYLLPTIAQKIYGGLEKLKEQK